MSNLAVLQAIRGDNQNALHREMQSVWVADGINDYILGPDASQFFWPNQRFTVSFWVFWTAGGSVIPSRSTHFMAVRANSNALLPGFTAGERFLIAYSATFIALAYGTTTSNFLYISNSNFVQDRWNHVVICHDANTSYVGTKIFLNSLEIQGTATPITGFSNTSRAWQQSFLGTDWTTINDFSGARHTDFMITSVYATPQEVRHLYNYGTNTQSQYSDNYPARLLNARQLHLPLGVGSLTGPAISPALAFDVSGFARDYTIFGQGTNPITNPF